MAKETRTKFINRQKKESTKTPINSAGTAHYRNTGLLSTLKNEPAMT
ncbi:MAG: hypothetical protein J7K84_06515 [Deltaproteobacteria bacterium]|nr:hypothetical protein [Deltaproteobacteria bacterium]